MFEVRITNRAVKDLKKLTPKLQQKARDIFENILSKNPYLGKKLVGDLRGNYSYELTDFDRIIYSIDKDAKVVYIKRAKGHYRK